MKTQARDLIVFGEDWGALPSSTQHLIQHLRKDRKVLWVNSIGLRQPTFTLRDVRRIVQKLLAKPSTNISTPHSHPQSQPNDANFQVLCPKTFPAPKSLLARWFSRLLLISQLKPAIEKLGMDAPVLWTSLPTAVDLAGHLDEHALVYYCGDDFGSLAGVDHTTVAHREKELVSKANLIFAVSQNLINRFPKDTAHLLPHGVDFSLFSQPAPRAHDLPNNGNPTAGFYGSISEWMDIPLLEHTIRQLPHWNFVFIGKISTDVSRLTALPNTLFLGEKAHSALPSYSQHWTASLLPFKKNPQIHSCNPLKLREYLAAGKPIISTDFPSAQEYHHYINIIADADGLVRALEQAIDDRNTYFRKQAVSNQTWEAQADRVAGWLNTL